MATIFGDFFSGKPLTLNIDNVSDGSFANELSKLGKGIDISGASDVALFINEKLDEILKNQTTKSDLTKIKTQLEEALNQAFLSKECKEFRETHHDNLPVDYKFKIEAVTLTGKRGNEVSITLEDYKSNGQVEEEKAEAEREEENRIRLKEAEQEKLRSDEEQN